MAEIAAADPLPDSAPSLGGANDAVWQFKRSILDRLDEYHACLRRMRRYDPAAYALYARVGLSIPADRYFADEEGLATQHRPTFGGILCGAMNTNNGRCTPSVIYFEKIARPARVQCVRGDVYRVTAVYDDRAGRRDGYRAKLSLPVVYHISVQDGRPVLLPELTTTWRRVTTKRGKKRETFRLGTKSWTIPDRVATVNADLRAEHEWTSTLNPVEWLFALAFNTHAVATRRIIVRARRSGITAAFGIELGRAKQFFCDRDPVLAPDGKRRRIFHAVRAHERQLATGKRSQVKYHYRGTRKFDWRRYRLTIALPTVQDITTFDASARYLTDLPKSERGGMLDMAQVGQRLGTRAES